MKHAGFFLFAAGLAVLIGWLGWQVYTTAHARHSLFDISPSMTLGASDADLKIVAFFAYDCRPCQDLQEPLNEALKKDGHVLLIPRAIKSDSDESVHAAVLAYAAGNQGKFPEMHNALMRNYRVINEDVLNDLTTMAGVDLEKLSKATLDSSIPVLIKQNNALHKNLHLPQIPVFLVGRDIVYSPAQGVTAEDFLKVFAAARSEK